MWRWSAILRRASLTVFALSIVLVNALTVGCLTVLAAGAAIQTAPEQLEAADAVVSLAPQAGRLSVASALHGRLTGSTLVVSTGFASADHNPSRIGSDTEALWVHWCFDQLPAQTECINPTPTTTLGEALAVRALADAHDWSHIVVVTSDYHVARTNFIFQNCLAPGSTIEVVGVGGTLQGADWVYRVVYEAVAFLKAAVETRVVCGEVASK